MSYIYDPEIEEEEDDGYSIPKILVAILLLVLIGAGLYIFNQQRKIKDVVFMLKSEKDQVDRELSEMIEKYNLAIDDNEYLADELSEERDRIIRFRDSIRNVRKEDFDKNKSLQSTIASLKSNSALDFSSDNTPVTTPTTETITVNSDENKSLIPENSNSITPGDEDVIAENTDSPPASISDINTAQETSVKEPDQNNNKAKTTETSTAPQSFTRVEIPPTYPGCSGSIADKKACFNSKVRSIITKKFDPSIAADLDLESGTNRVYVAFTVDKFGNVTNIKAKGPHERLEREAIKATQSLPKMTAARQNGVPVDVNYNVPITFIVE
jgi:protein TonB